MGRTVGMGAGLVAPPAPTPELPPDTDLQELIAKYLKRIAERVAPPKYEVLQFVNGTVQLFGDFDTGGNEVNSVVVDVKAGQLDLFLTNDGGTTNITPYTFTALGQP